MTQPNDKQQVLRVPSIDPAVSVQAALLARAVLNATAFASTDPDDPPSLRSVGLTLVAEGLLQVTSGDGATAFYQPLGTGEASVLRALRSAQATIAMACKPPVITVDRDRVGTAVYACATCTCGYRGPWRRDVDGFPSQALQDCEAHDVATHGLVVPAGPATRIAAMHCDSCGRLVGEKQAAKYADTYQLDWALCPRCEVDA